jgi:hypothetical protein
MIRCKSPLAQRVERVHADLQRLMQQYGIIEEQRRLKEWPDKLLDQQIPNGLGAEPT